jgi:hypothetical protein
MRIDDVVYTLGRCNIHQSTTRTTGGAGTGARRRDGAAAADPVRDKLGRVSCRSQELSTRATACGQPNHTSSADRLAG